MENTATEDIKMKKAIEDCSLVVRVLLSQPDMTENDKIKGALTFIRQEATQLGIPLDMQGEFMDAVYVSTIAEHILEQKCLNCRKNQPETGTSLPIQIKIEDIGLGGMYI